MRLRFTIAVLAASALLAAACGDDDDSTGTDPASADTSAPSGDTPAPGADTTAPGPGTTVGRGTGDTTDTSAATSGPAGDCTLDEPLTIGYAADFSELGAFADQPGSEAARVQVDLINEAGGVGGQNVEYIVKELPSDTSAAQRAAQELLDEGADAIIAPPFASVGVPLIDTVNGAVPIISNASTDLQLAQPDRGAFLMSFSDPVQAAAAAEFVGGEGGATTAVTFSSPDDSYFTEHHRRLHRDLRAGGRRGAPRLHLFPRRRGLLRPGQRAGGSRATTRRAVHGDGHARRRRPAGAARSRGLGDIRVIGADAFDATAVWSAGDVANGVSFTAHTFPRDDNGVQEFIDATADAGVEIETVSFGALASDVVKVFAHVAETTCSLDGPTLIEAISNISDLELTTGTVTYARHQRRARARRGDPHRRERGADVHRGLPAELHPGLVAGRTCRVAAHRRADDPLRRGRGPARGIRARRRR